jgi:hypothetical protein
MPTVLTGAQVDIGATYAVFTFLGSGTIGWN